MVQAKERTGVVLSASHKQTSVAISYPHPLLLKSPHPLHVTLCLATGGHLVPCLSPQTCLPRRAMANDQPKASKFPALVPEHCAVILVRGPSQSLANLPCAPMARLKAPWPIPADCSCTISSIPADQLHYRLTGVLLPMPWNPALRMPKSLSWPGVSHTARRLSWQPQ